MSRAYNIMHLLGAQVVSSRADLVDAQENIEISVALGETPTDEMNVALSKAVAYAKAYQYVSETIEGFEELPNEELLAILTKIDKESHDFWWAVPRSWRVNANLTEGEEEYYRFLMYAWEQVGATARKGFTVENISMSVKKMLEENA